MSAADDLRRLADEGAVALEIIPELEATIDRLEARVAELEAGQRPKAQFGLNLTGGDVAGHRALMGGADLKNLRLFFQPGEAPHWKDVTALGVRPADRPWFSAKTLTEATFRAWVRAMPAAWVAQAEKSGEPYRFTFMHEGEADIFKSADPDGGIARYLDTYAMMLRVCADEPNGRHVEPWKILLRYTQAEGGTKGRQNSWPRFVGDQEIPVGMDCYWQGWWKTYMPAAQLLAPIVEIGEKTGLRIAVPEVGGVPMYTTKSGGRGRWDDTGEGRRAAILDLIKYVPTTAIESINWWCGTGAQGNHHLELFGSNVAAWKAGMTG